MEDSLKIPIINELHLAFPPGPLSLVKKKRKDFTKHALTYKFHMDIPDPVSAAFLLPVALHIEVVQPVSVQLDHFAHVSFRHFLIRPTASHHHSHLKLKVN